MAFYDLLDLNIYDCPILLLEFRNSCSTKDHPDATNLFQVLLLHIHSFHLEGIVIMNYFEYLSILFEMTTLNIPSWLVLWFVPSISELTLQRPPGTAIPEIIQSKYITLFSFRKTVYKRIFRGADLFHSSKAVFFSKRVFVSKFLQRY